MGVHFLSPPLKCIHSSSSLLKLRLLFIEIKLILNCLNGRESEAPSLQHNINMRSQLVTEGWGWVDVVGLWVSVKQLQVSDWHFALLAASLTHQPV